MSCPEPLPATVSVLASTIADGLSDNEVALLAALFPQLGDSLALILALRARQNCPVSLKYLINNHAPFPAISLISESCRIKRRLSDKQIRIVFTVLRPRGHRTRRK